jgi:hypothetical protein
MLSAIFRGRGRSGESLLAASLFSDFCQTSGDGDSADTCVLDGLSLPILRYCVVIPKMS